MLRVALPLVVALAVAACSSNPADEPADAATFTSDAAVRMDAAQAQAGVDASGVALPDADPVEPPDAGPLEPPDAGEPPDSGQPQRADAGGGEPDAGPAAPDAGEVADASAPGPWDGCPTEQDFVGANWDLPLQVTEGGIYCASFNEMRTILEEYEEKAMVRFTPGAYSFPRTPGTYPFALPVCVRFREGEQAPAMAGAGSLTASVGYSNLSLRWSQPLRTPGGEDWALEGWASMPEVATSVSFDGSHFAPFGDVMVTMMLCKGDCTQWIDVRELDSCTFDGVPLQRHTVTFTGGSVVLDIRIGQSMASTEPALFVSGSGTLDGLPFQQLDYWKLVYNPEHHHFSRDFAVLFDAPASPDACGVLAQHLTPWPEATENPAVSVVDCSLAPTETRAILSHVFERP